MQKFKPKMKAKNIWCSSILMRNILLTPLCFLLQIGFSQNASLSGKIIDAETKQPLYAVTVIITGTSFGNNSDFDGAYEIKDIPPANTTSNFRISAMKKQFVPLKN
ncbi:MAG: carboxypeptidase-like regulatory domain-containing protein [Bacteroidetes bacterium]|nr:carboxypeptidase-like regulatory domain-containing protein [Bacteroidota bacterium]